MMRQSGVRPDGSFAWGLHAPSYRVRNMRRTDHVTTLGSTSDGELVDNQANFPKEDVVVANADDVYEIPNALPFRGVTYIGKRWADARAESPDEICLPTREACFFVAEMKAKGVKLTPAALIAALPQPLKLALATTSTDPRDLVALAHDCARFTPGIDSDAPPGGLVYARDKRGRLRPEIDDEQLFDAVANNPALPDVYKAVMVLRPGVQGNSEIVGDWQQEDDAGDPTHIFEYLRTNSYIPWGHYAANMAHDAVRYDAAGLSTIDIRGLRGLYYQRTYLRLAEQLAIELPKTRRPLGNKDLENLRCAILKRLKAPDAPRLRFNATLWGWNYGFDFAPTRYRLHASHQQIHQQFALIPREVDTPADTSKPLPSYACGDMVADLCRDFRQRHGSGFFNAYHWAIRTNKRLDGRSDREASLVVHAAEGVMIFVPKAQTSQWELQIMPTRSVGNILEAAPALRQALDRALHLAMQILIGLGASMVTVIEYSKRFDAAHSDQHLLYALLPRLPESPGAFSEAQLRWINGHYPEDFAAVCRRQLDPLGYSTTASA